VGKDLFPVLARIRPPLAGGIDQVGLDIEDELVAAEDAAGSGALVCRLLGQAEAAASLALSCERLVERPKARGRRAKRPQKGTPTDAKALGVHTNPFPG